MSEALVQIEPATFTPTWFAGVLKSAQASHENLGVLLNMLLHYYRSVLNMTPPLNDKEVFSFCSISFSFPIADIISRSNVCPTSNHNQEIQCYGNYQKNTWNRKKITLK